MFNGVDNWFRSILLPFFGPKGTVLKEIYRFLPVPLLSAVCRKGFPQIIENLSHFDWVMASADNAKVESHLCRIIHATRFLSAICSNVRETSRIGNSDLVFIGYT